MARVRFEVVPEAAAREVAFCEESSTAGRLVVLDQAAKCFSEDVLACGGVLDDLAQLEWLTRMLGLGFLNCVA